MSQAWLLWRKIQKFRCITYLGLKSIYIQLIVNIWRCFTSARWPLILWLILIHFKDTLACTVSLLSSYLIPYSFFFFNLVSGQGSHNTSSKYTLLKQERFYVVTVEKPYHQEILEPINRWNYFYTFICFL